MLYHNTLIQVGGLLFALSICTTSCSSDNRSYILGHAQVVIRPLNKALDIITEQLEQQKRLQKQHNVAAKEYHEWAILMRGITIRAPLVAAWGKMMQYISRGMQNTTRHDRFGSNMAQVSMLACTASILVWLVCSHKARIHELSAVQHSLSEKLHEATIVRMRTLGSQGTEPATLNDLSRLYKCSSPLHSKEKENIQLDPKQLPLFLREFLEQQLQTTLQEIEKGVRDSMQQNST